MGRVPGVRLHLAAGFAGMSSEFDQYARDYDELLKDPLRDRFAASQAFFHYRKWLLIDRFRRRYFGPNAAVDWLDAGCGRGELLSLGEGRFRRTAGCDVSSEMLRASGGVEIKNLASWFLNIVATANNNYALGVYQLFVYHINTFYF